MNQYYKKIDGHWCHRAPRKLIINPILRLIQFWRNDPYVIASITNMEKKNPIFIEFKICRVKYR